MTHIAMSMISHDEGARTFLIARGKAIQKYAEYEQALGGLYAILMGVTEDVAGVTFFKINNARSRTAILERLLKKKCADTYSTFWNSFAKHIGQLDQKRNEIIHWATVVGVNIENGIQKNTLMLMPPNIWDHKSGAPRLFVDDIYDFMLKADFLERLINCFGLTISQKFTQEEFSTWPEIFLEELIYPPPDSHPLIRK